MLDKEDKNAVDISVLKMQLGAFILTLNKEQKKIYDKKYNEILGELRSRLKKSTFGV